MGNILGTERASAQPLTGEGAWGVAAAHVRETEPGEEAGARVCGTFR